MVHPIAGDGVLFEVSPEVIETGQELQGRIHRHTDGQTDRKGYLLKIRNVV
jgi:hypothetical protein